MSKIGTSRPTLEMQSLGRATHKVIGEKGGDGTFDVVLGGFHPLQACHEVVLRAPIDFQKLRDVHILSVLLLLVTSATLVVTGALLVVTKKLLELSLK